MKRLNDFLFDDLVMIVIVGLIVFAVLAGPGICRGDPVTDGAKYVSGKVADPDWLSRKALKYGFLLTICATNTLRMAREADEFDSRDLLGKDSHHLVDIGIVAGCVMLGWEFYAIMERDSWTWKEKTQLISSGIFLCREFGEFTYQGMRHGDPFNNNPEWHKSELPGFAAKATFPYLRDNMISTGRVTTPALHFALTGLGTNLLGKVR